MKIIKTISILFCIGLAINSFAQKKIKPEDKVVFVYFEGRENNFLMVPNFGKLPKFKIYKKFKDETEYKLVAEKRKPSLPMKNNVSPSGVSWEDIDTHSREINYKVIAYDKNDKELCVMQIIWEDEK